MSCMHFQTDLTTALKSNGALMSVRHQMCFSFIPWNGWQSLVSFTRSKYKPPFFRDIRIIPVFKERGELTSSKRVAGSKRPGLEIVTIFSTITCQLRWTNLRLIAMDEPIGEDELFTHSSTLFVRNGVPMAFSMQFPKDFEPEETHILTKKRIRAYVLVRICGLR